MTDKIDSLCQSVQKIGDVGLMNEILGKVADLQHHVFRTLQQMGAQDGEIEALGTRLAANGVQTWNSPPFVYDPPV